MGLNKILEEFWRELDAHEEANKKRGPISAEETLAELRRVAREVYSKPRKSKGKAWVVKRLTGSGFS